MSEVDIRKEGGMARVEFEWEQAFEKRGINFIHIGPKQVGQIRHPYFFPSRAYQYYKQLKISASAFIVHEPAGGAFVNNNTVCFIESHGIERRYWDLQLNSSIQLLNEKPSFKTKLLFPLWRLANCDKGLRKADKLLLINSEDADYVKTKYKRADSDFFLFRNGVYQADWSEENKDDIFTILFNGSWIARKGIHVFVEAAKQLYSKGYTINYLLTGTGKKTSEVLSDWPDYLHKFVQVVPTFTKEEETAFLNASNLFVLPSFYEGQPLSLLQAMAAGKCCITTICCGQKDIIQSGKNGFLFDTGNVNELVNLIEVCINKPAMRLSIGASAYTTVQNRSWLTVSNEVVDYVMSFI